MRNALNFNSLEVISKYMKLFGGSVKKKTAYVAVIAIIVIVFAALALTSFSGQSNASYINSELGKPVSQQAMSLLNVPSSVSDKIGIGSVSGFPTSISAPALESGGKPEILYIGAEYCPYCAITRWGMIIALMRFGNFYNLHYMASNASDVFPNTPTFTFYNSTYTSNYIVFVSVETTTRSRFQNLQEPTPLENSIFSKYNPGGGIPFVDFANESIQLGAPLDPEIVAGYTWNGILSNLTDTNSSISQSIVGSADVFTAEICKITNDTPESVCSQPYVTETLNALGSKGT